MKPETTKLLLVDDHPVVREGLRRLQELMPGIQIVAEAATMQSAVASVRALQPEVVLMDVRLPDGDGIEACRRIKALSPSTHVLFLTSYADNRFVLAAMEAGGDGYLLRDSDTQRIVDAVRTIMDGGEVFDPVVDPGEMPGGAGGPGVNPLAALTVQERKLLAEVARGKTDKEVAAALSLTTKTARNYLDRVFVKLNVHTRTEAALLYARFRDAALPSE
ncbi:MAG: response regulator transcription factor [Verrucomicrobia bacterium]|nr:response regulator transcription factor [Verrucomicrobiota bacterium]